MNRRTVLPAALRAPLGGVIGPIAAPGFALAQDGTAQINTLFRVTLEDADLPPAPVFMRLLSISMDPGSSSPNHTHPGPEFWYVQSGVVTVKVQGPTILLKNGQGEKEAPAPVNENFDMKRGDRITFIPGTPLTFANKGTDSVTILIGVILPAGHQFPPGVTYVDGQPAADAFQGLTTQILADGRSDVFPNGQTTITVDRVKMTSGQALPALPNTELISVAKPSMEVTIVSGEVYESRTASPGPQETPLAAGTSLQLGEGDALFLPAGNQEATRDASLADLTVYRLWVEGTEPAATPVPADSVGVIQITGPKAPEPTATPEASKTPKPTAQPTEQATQEPTLTATGKFQVGETVYVNDTSVRLRDAPTTSSNIVTGLTINQELVITGESQSGDDITWWPVADASDSTLAGWVAEQFLSDQPVPE